MNHLDSGTISYVTFDRDIHNKRFLVKNTKTTPYIASVALQNKRTK